MTREALSHNQRAPDCAASTDAGIDYTECFTRFQIVLGVIVPSVSLALDALDGRSQPPCIRVIYDHCATSRPDALLRFQRCLTADRSVSDGLGLTAPDHCDGDPSPHIRLTCARLLYCASPINRPSGVCCTG